MLQLYARAAFRAALSLPEVGLWHLSDLPAEPENVCQSGKSGRSACARRLPKMT